MEGTPAAAMMASTVARITLGLCRAPTGADPPLALLGLAEVTLP